MSASNSSSFWDEAADDVEFFLSVVVFDLEDTMLIGILVLADANLFVALLATAPTAVGEVVLVAEFLVVVVLSPPFVKFLLAEPLLFVEDLSCFLNCRDIIRSKSVAGLSLLSLFSKLLLLLVPAALLFPPPMIGVCFLLAEPLLSKAFFGDVALFEGEEEEEEAVLLIVLRNCITSFCKVPHSDSRF